MLETLEDSNLLVIGLDRQRHWYRYHHLFRDLLLADLERRAVELREVTREQRLAAAA
mgnify:CR=1 FL=1